MNASILGYLNEIGITAAAQTPPDQNTIGLVQAVVNELTTLPAAYNSTGTTATPFFNAFPVGAGSIVAVGEPSSLTFDTLTATVKSTGIPPQSTGA